MGNVVQFPKQRRRHPRVLVRQPVALVHANGTVATVLAVNLSIGGLQVIADRYTLDALLPSSSWSASVIGPAVDAHFKLPLRSHMTKLDIGCQVTYVTPCEASRFLIGLEFVHCPASSKAALQEFLDEAAALDLA